MKSKTARWLFFSFSFSFFLSPNGSGGTGRFSGSGFEAWATGLRRDVADAEIRAEMAFAAADEFSVGGPAGASSCAWFWPWP